MWHYCFPYHDSCQWQAIKALHAHKFSCKCLNADNCGWFSKSMLACACESCFLNWINLKACATQEHWVFPQIPCKWGSWMNHANNINPSALFFPDVVVWLLFPSVFLGTSACCGELVSFESRLEMPVCPQFLHPSCSVGNFREWELWPWQMWAQLPICSTFSDNFAFCCVPFK